MYVCLKQAHKHFLFAHTELSLKALFNELRPVRASWYNIGLQLNVLYTTLDRFRELYSDPSDLLREMLKFWLKTAVDPPPTWETVVTALRSPSVNEKSVAAQLEAEYCLPVQHVMGEFNSIQECITLEPLYNRHHWEPTFCPLQ